MKFLAELIAVDPDQIKSPVRKSFNKLLKFSFGLLTIFALVFGILSDGFEYSLKNLYEDNINNSYKKSMKRLRKSNKDFKVAILPFLPDQHCKYKKSNYEKIILSRFDKMIREEGLSVEVGLINTRSCPILTEDVLKIGRNSQADLLLWGEYDESCEDPTKIRMRYAFLHGNDWLEPSFAQSRKGELPDVELLREGYLQRDIDNILYYSLALSALKKGEWDDVIRFADKTDVYETYRADVVKETIYNIIFQIKLSKSLLTNIGTQEEVIYRSVYEDFTLKERVALSYFMLGKYEKAIKYYRELNKEYTGLFTIDIAICHYRMGEYKEVISLESRFGLTGRNLDLILRTHYKMGQTELGLKTLERFIEQEPKEKSLSNTILHTKRYHFLVELERHQEATELLLWLKSQDHFAPTLVEEDWLEKRPIPGWHRKQ